jgi:hypothetical protein
MILPNTFTEPSRLIGSTPQAHDAFARIVAMKAKARERRERTRQEVR